MSEKIAVKVELGDVDVTDRLMQQPLQPRRGRQPEASVVSPGELTVVLNNDDGALTDLPLGTVARLCVEGPSEVPWIVNGEPVLVDGEPVLFGADEWPCRMTGEVMEVAPYWPTGRDDHADVAVTVAGLQRRLGQESRQVIHPIEELPSDGIVGWWPLTDAESSGAFAARVGEDAVASVTSGWREGDIGTGSAPVLRIGPTFEGSFSAQLAEPVEDEWTVSFVIDADKVWVQGAIWYAGFTLLAMMTDEGPWSLEFLPNHVNLGPGWKLQLRRPEDSPQSPPAVFVRLDNLPGSTSSTSRPTTGRDSTGGPVLIEAGLSGGESWLRVTDVSHRVFLVSSAVTSSPGALLGVGGEWVTGGWPAVDVTMVDHIDIGQVIVSGEPVPNLREAASAWLWERAGRRIERLCAAEDIHFVASGDLDLTAPMGPQPAGNLIDILLEAAHTDGGVLDETRDALGWRYVTRESLATAPAAFMAPLTHVVPADGSLLPVRDDLRWATVVSVVSGDRTVTVEGIDAVPRLAREVTVNTPSLEWQQWRAEAELAQGQERWRWSSVTLHLTLRPGDDGSLSMWLTANVGDRIRIPALPSQSPFDEVDMVLEDIIDDIAGHRWVARVSGSPSGSWQMAPPAVETPAWGEVVPETVAPAQVMYVYEPPPLAVMTTQGNRVQEVNSFEFDENRVVADGLAVVFTTRASSHDSGPNTPSGWTLAGSQAQSGDGGVRCFVREVTDNLPATVNFSNFGAGYRSIVGMVLEPIGPPTRSLGDSWGWSVSSGQVSGSAIMATNPSAPARPEYAWARSYIFAFGEAAAGSPAHLVGWQWWVSGVGWREAGGSLRGDPSLGGGGGSSWGHPPGVLLPAPTLTMPNARDWAWIHLLVWREHDD